MLCKFDVLQLHAQVKSRNGCTVQPVYIELGGDREIAWFISVAVDKLICKLNARIQCAHALLAQTRRPPVCWHCTARSIYKA